MKKILFITPFEPSKRTGGQNFTRLLLRDLSKNNKVDLIMFLNKKADFELPKINTTLLRVFYVKKLIKFFNILMIPFCFPFFSSRFNIYYLLIINKYVRKGEYDYIYIDYSQLFIYGIFFPNTKKILMSHDIILQRYQRKSSRMISYFCALSEAGILRRQINSKVFTFSKKDSDILLHKYNIHSIITSFYLEIPTSYKINNLFNRIVLFGSWKRNDNLEGLLWFLEYIQPKLNDSIEITIIGGGLKDSIIRNISKLNNTKYLGFVPEPSQIISESKALIAPIFHGAGVKVKVIESLALGTTVIGTEIAFEGVPLEFSEYMLIANNIDDFVQIINQYDTDIDNKRRLQSNFSANYINHSISEYINFGK